MVFSSWTFILGFLPVALGVFLILPPSWRDTRKAWLCLTSLFFYGYWKVEYVPLLLFSIGFNFAVAKLIHRWRGDRRGRGALIAGLAVNLLLLGYYKYTNFLVSSLGLASELPFPEFDIILPLAISFFTFTQIGYIVDVWRDPKLDYRFVDYALFVLFFPHLIAGPIVRHWEVIPQFAPRDLRVSATDLAVGVAFFLMGLYKKLLLADPMARYADAIYGAAAGGAVLPWFDAWLGTVAYALQIYFDFSGYSDMAIGLARMFAIKFPCNFDSPYKALSLSDFWRRWHMSLMRFLRDYVYIPLGGNRCGLARQSANVLFVFFLSGFWHGAGWTFIVWGLIHGAGIVVALYWRKFTEWRGWQFRHWSYRGACLLLTFITVLFAWVFFRAPDLPTAGRVAGSMVGVHGLTISEKTTKPEGAPGEFLSAVGFKFVPDVSGLVPMDYDTAIRLTVVLLLFVWLLPNTQQLLHRYDPALEEYIHPSRFQIRLSGWQGLTLGLALGACFFVVIRQSFTAASSPFLYFNF
jgi:D-alanyl-lipoteichoic acid acyltransferase DltB (MBOAT superfamily)